MTRQKLPNRRESEIFKLEIINQHGRHAIYLNVGFDEEGKVKEIFLNANKTGSEERGYLDCVARFISLGLQHGIPLEEFVEMAVGTHSQPRGSVTNYQPLRGCYGPIDLAFKVLGIEYCGRDDLRQREKKDD